MANTPLHTQKDGWRSHAYLIANTFLSYQSSLFFLWDKNCPSMTEENALMRKPPQVYVSNLRFLALQRPFQACSPPSEVTNQIIWKSSTTRNFPLSRPPLQVAQSRPSWPKLPHHQFRNLKCRRNPLRHLQASHPSSRSTALSLIPDLLSRTTPPLAFSLQRPSSSTHCHASSKRSGMRQPDPESRRHCCRSLPCARRDRRA